jgi:hypothetical protein
MSTMPSFKELMDEIGAIAESLPKAKEDYLEADSTYDGRGVQLEKAVLKNAHEYLEEKNRKAERIKEAARDLEENIRSFNRLRGSLSENEVFRTDLAIFESIRESLANEIPA